MFGLYMAMMVNTAMITKTHIRYLNRLVALGFILLWGLIMIQIYYPLPTRGLQPPVVVDIGESPLTEMELVLDFCSTIPSSRNLRKRSAITTTSEELQLLLANSTAAWRAT